MPLGDYALVDDVQLGAYQPPQVSDGWTPCVHASIESMRLRQQVFFQVMRITLGL